MKMGGDDCPASLSSTNLHRSSDTDKPDVQNIQDHVTDPDLSRCSASIPPNFSGSGAVACDGKQNTKSRGTDNVNKTEFTSNAENFGAWIMEGFYPVPIIPQNSSVDGTGMIPNGEYPVNRNQGDTNVKIGNVVGVNPAGDNRMAMCYYMPSLMMDQIPDYGKDNKQSMQHSQCILPMFPLMQNLDEGLAMHGFGKINMAAVKPNMQRKPSYSVEHVKAIPTSVQIREMCQLKSWKKKIQRSRGKLKAHADQMISNKLQPPIEASKPTLDHEIVQPSKTETVKDTKMPDIGTQCNASAGKKHFRTMEMSWVLNKFTQSDDLSESDMSLRLFDKRELEDPDLRDIKGSFGCFIDMELSCYPYQLAEGHTFLSKTKNGSNFALWSKDEDYGCFLWNDTNQGQDSKDFTHNEKAVILSLETDEKSPSQDTKEESSTIVQKNEEEYDLMDELEDELLDGLSSDNAGCENVNIDSDLDDEFDFDMTESHETIPQMPHIAQKKHEKINDEITFTYDDAETKNFGIFGEVPGTVSHDNAKLVHLLNNGDVSYEWRSFRSRLTGKLTLSDIVEFDNTRRLIHEKRVEALKRVLENDTTDSACAIDDGISTYKLYCVGKANLKLLLEYKRPEVHSIIYSSIYDLNASNVVYSMAPMDELSPGMDGTMQTTAPEQKDSLKEETEEIMAEVYKSHDADDLLLQGKESDIRRNWRRKLQTLGKETRLALVNMGKSLKDIDNASTNIEQSRAYDSVVEFYEVAEQFRGRDYINMLNQSFDDAYEKSDPHNTGKETRVSNRRELVHTRVAKNLTCILPLVGRCAKFHYSRFHRPDFRVGLFSAHTRVLRGGYSQEWSAWPVRPVTKSATVASFTEEDFEDLQNHPSNYFVHSNDLTLGDDCKVALFEYIEQFPLLLENCGMTSRIDNYIHSVQEGEESNVVSLGPIGTICQTTDGIEIFGIKHTLSEGEGQAILENTLFRAPIFVHPRPDPSPSSDVSNRNFTSTDFLLVKNRVKGEVFIRLRPLTWQSGIAVYTVGQCEPKLEVPSPNSKSYVDGTKDLLKAWALKSIMTGTVLDTKHLRREARKNFCPALSEKDIGQVLKQIESTPIFSSRPQTLERMIHSTIKPEMVCSLESTRACRYRLKNMGILKLKNTDNIGAIFAKMQQEEKQYQQRLQSAEKRRRELKGSYAKRLEAHGITGDKLAKELSQFDFGLRCSIYGHLEQRTLAPKIRFIEEVLKLTSWNLSRDVKHVLNNRGSAQFVLYGFADPSGGRGEAINLLKRQARDTTIDTTAGEDLRKLSMEELGKRLTRYGVAEAVIKTLPRWDQVALVRQYRDGFGGNTFAEGDNRWRIPPEEYQKKLNEILLRQRAALLPDDPEISEDDNVASEKENYAGKLTNEDATEGIADALLEAFDEESDKDDDLEMRELEILRQLRETQNAGPLTEEEKIAEVNKLRAVPGLMWLRQSRKTPGEPFGNERAVFIYGEENIRKILKWRQQRSLAKKCHLLGDLGASSALAGKRVCRACGQYGHIASNPKCPLYRGDKTRAVSINSAIVANRVGFGKKPYKYSDSNDGEIAASVAALEKDTTEWVRQNMDSISMRQKRKSTRYQLYDDSEDGMESEDDVSMVNVRRRHKGMNSQLAAADGLQCEDEEGSISAGNLMENMEPIMKVISKVLRMVEKEPRFKPFAARIPESIAPNYYKIIKNPMWLALLKAKCKSRCYKNIIQFLNDLALIEHNCKQFNSEASPNAWLRQMSETLVDDIVQRTQHALIQYATDTIIEDWMQKHRSKRGGDTSGQSIAPSQPVASGNGFDPAEPRIETT